MAFPREDSGAGDNEQVDVLHYARMLLAEWPILLGTMIAGIVAAGIYVWLAPPLHRASMKLMVVPSLPDDAGDRSSGAADRAARYIPFFTNADTIERALAARGLSGGPRGRLSGFDLTATSPDQSSILELTLDFHDPDEAPDLLAAIAEEAIRLNREMVLKDDRQAHEFLRAQLAEAAARVNEHEEALEEFRQDSVLGERRRIWDDLIADTVLQESLLREKRVEEVGLASSVEEMTQLLEAQQRVLQLRRTLLDDPAAGATSSGVDVAATTIQTEVINPLYEQAEPRLVLERSRLAGVRAERRQLFADVETSRRRIRDLAGSIAAEEKRFEQLREALSLARSAHRALFEQHERLRVAIAARSAELRVFESPRAGGARIAPRMRPAMAAGTALGLLAGVLLILLRQLVSGIRIARHPAGRADSDRMATF